jgi:hypothetical protein
MTTYHLDTALALRVHALLMWAAGATLAAIGLVYVSNRDDGGREFPFVIVAVFIGAFVWGGIAKLREVSEIRLLEDGTVEIARGLGGIRLGAGDIYRLEGTLKQEYSGGPTWHLRIHHAGGRVSCAQFRDVTDFVDRVRAANPRVAITGVWPMGIPPIHSSMRQV